MGKRILVADDSLTIQKVIRLALSNEGYEIQTVSDGADAVQQISLFRPHAVLVDISLPTQSAFEIKRVINSQPDTRNVKFILMSSAFEKVDENQASQLRFEGRLTKPFDPAHLRQVIADVLKDEPGTSEMPPLPNPMEHSGSGPSISISDLPSANDSDEGEGPSFVPPGFTLPPPPKPSQPPKPSIDELKADEFPPLGDIPSFAPPQAFEKPEEPAVPRFPPPPPSISVQQQEERGPRDFPSDPLLDSFNASSGHELSTLPESEPENEAEAPHPDQDIKHLTESTIRMSGLDDFDWSISETGKKDASKAPLREPPEPAIEPPGSFSDFESSHFSFNESLGPSISVSEQEESIEHTPVAPRPVSASASVPTGKELSSQIEETVRAEIQRTLEKMAKEILPEVAERIIKAEIHKLLNEKL